MNLKLSRLVVFISFFPAWALRSNLNYLEIFISLIVFILLPIILFSFFFKKNISLNNNLYIFIISIIIIYGIDNHLGLRSSVAGWNADTSMIIKKGLLYISLGTGVLFFFTKVSNFKLTKVFCVFLITIFIFNLFDQTKSYKKIVNFQKNKLQKLNSTTIIFMLDEMSGINSIESKKYNGKEFIDYSQKFFKKYNFNVFPNAKTIDSGTILSISNALNFSLVPGHETGQFYLDDKENYFHNHKLIKNLLFQKFKSVSVFQNMYINYCLDINVTKCSTYNPFTQSKFIKGFKNNPLSKIFSSYEINGSIIGFLSSRLLKRLRIIDVLSEPLGEKITFENTLKEIEKDILSREFDLIFTHIIVPHIPYGYSKNCNYDGALSSYSTSMTFKDKVIQHNIERICVLKFLDNTFENLKNKNIINDLDIIIASDHGSKISNTDFFSTILANKTIDSQYMSIQKEITIQRFIKKKFDK